MKFETVSLFNTQYKKLAKKNKLISSDLKKFADNFEILHTNATQIKSNLYKIRLANSSKNKGKSAGYRLYYYLKIGDTVYLLTIYDKSEIEMINENILNKFISEINS